MTPILGIIASSKPAKPTVTGGTLTSDATYYYRTFTSSGTLTVSNANLAVTYLVVGGGGGGYQYGAGGAGGYIATTGTLSPAAYSVSVGAKSASTTFASSGGTGNPSSFNSQTASGGNPGTAYPSSDGSGSSGNPTSYSAGTTAVSGNYKGGGGGGGSSAVGSNGYVTGVDGYGAAGGAGTTWIDGVTYAKGGDGGGSYSGSSGDNSNGLLGNGGNANPGVIFPDAPQYQGQQGIVIVAYLKTAV